MNVHGCNYIGVLQLTENFPFLIPVITVTPGGEEGVIRKPQFASLKRVRNS